MIFNLIDLIEDQIKESEYKDLQYSKIVDVSVGKPYDYHWKIITPNLGKTHIVTAIRKALWKNRVKDFWFDVGIEEYENDKMPPTLHVFVKKKYDTRIHR